MVVGGDKAALKPSQEERRPERNPKKKAAFEDLHFGWSLQCVERLDLLKGKQITGEVKGRGGTLVETLGCFSPRCRLASPFEGGFHYNNIPNQSLELPSLGIFRVTRRLFLFSFLRGKND